MDEKTCSSKAIQVWRLYVDLWKLWYKKAERDLNGVNLSVTEFTIMRQLSENGPLSMATIASSINVTPGWVTGVIDKMEDKGLVVRKREEADRRIIKISLTDHGKEVYEEAKKKHFSFIEKSLSGLNDSDLDMAYKILSKMIASINALE
ncbi:MarR family winged helix-turn-helix transcriptional regulator [Thermoplasma sp. Kam2015]|uniref:MarR family winged helix-turn-helix transcriptional regulator n=1 Tax=Thermoplasma sp. Kam2015 TaxID=2094122 RepID=UPI001F3C7D16|nr:MarR family transcriptional regulator [Thermoplasma sp. Kam2015]